MVVLGCALFIGTALLSWLHAGSAVSAVSRDVAASRALARSGLGAIAAELNRQRRTILRGESPSLESQYVLIDEGDRLGVIRLLPIGLSGERLVAEAGKLDVNMIDDAATLVATGLVMPDLAEEIIRHRDEVLQRPYQSEVELLNVRGMTAEILYGSIERLANADAPAASASSGGLEPAGLIDVLTVYSIEPALQENGKLRINLNVQWSDELHDRVADRFGEEIASGLKQIFDQGVKFDSEKRMFELLRFFQVPPEEWHEATDSFTAEDGDYHRGRLDLNTASYEALRGLPGIEFEQASQLASAQGSLTAEERKSVAWPAMLDILRIEQMDGLGGRITTRSWTWRVRFEAGAVDGDNPDGPLEGALTYEAVIDLASPQPRIAYLREVTLLSDAVLIASAIEATMDSEDEDELSFDEDLEGEDDTTQENALDGDEEELESDRGLDFGMEPDRDDSLDFGGRDDDDEDGEEDRGEADEDGARDAQAGGSPAPRGPARIGRWVPGK